VVPPRREARLEGLARLDRRGVREDGVLERRGPEVEEGASPLRTVVVADGDVDERRRTAVVHDSGAGVGRVTVYRYVGEIHVGVTTEPTTPGCHVAAEGDTVQRGGAGLVVDAPAEARGASAGVVADRDVRQRQDIAVRDSATSVITHILRHDDPAQVQRGDVVDEDGTCLDTTAGLEHAGLARR